MTFQEFIDKYLGKKVDFDGSYGGQCVDLYRQYVKDVIGGLQSAPVVGASDIWETYNKNTFTRIENTHDGVPVFGDVIIWNNKAGGGFGHVAIFISGTASSFISLDQNWPTLSVVTKTNHNYTNVLGWLHPKENMANELDICLTDRQKFWDERDSLLRELQADSVEGGINTVRGLRSRITDLTNQLGTAQAEVKNKEELLSRSQQEVLKLNDDINTLESRLDQSNNTVTQLGKDKGTLAIQVEQLKIQIETLKQANQQGGITQTSTIEQLISWFKNLWNKN